MKYKLFFRKHPLLAALSLSAALGAFFSVLAGFGLIRTAIINDYGFFEWVKEFLAILFGGTFIYGIVLIFPLVLVGLEIYLLAKGKGDRELYQKCRVIDVVGTALGIFYSLFYLSVVDEVVFGADWQEQLVNRQMHTPIYTGSLPAVIVIAAVAAAGYLVVNFIPLKKMPPLATVLGMAAMYLGTAESIFWGIQVVKDPTDILLLLLPIYCVLVTARTVRCKMWEWQEMRAGIPGGDAGQEMADGTGQERNFEEETGSEGFREGACVGAHKQHGDGILTTCNRVLSNAAHWPVLAFAFMWPLLGLLIGILLLFGQRPDAVIRAFTETSDWNLSKQVAPQNIYYDEHYLCTVAAGGHEKVVKPKRLGLRHGHQVIVNRQLCVANAFEQVLEERTPRFHRAVRHFYDTCGFPVARLIRSKYTADIIYFLMKPLEWMFLVVLYLTDVNPENRIAIQYTGKGLKDFGLA